MREPASSKGRLAAPLAGHKNSLNFMRLVFALMVIASHALPLGQFGLESFQDRITMGTIGVFGFFGISGYLVAQSADRNSVGRYLWQRCLRIFPGFWLCLVVTVLVFGTIGRFELPSSYRIGCGYGCFLVHQGIPYVAHNLLLGNGNLAGTKFVGSNVLLNSTNASLWTLYYEFVCYLILAVLSLTRLLRKRLAVLSLAACLWLIEAFIVLTQSQSALTLTQTCLLSLAPVFLTGTVLYLYRDRLPDSGWLAIGMLAVVWASIFVPIGKTNFFSPLTNFVIAFSSVDLLAPALIYPVLWLGVHLHKVRIGSKNDYSYGCYIYGWPVERLLVSWHIQEGGYLFFVIAAVVCVAPFAVASWWLVEKRALRLKKLAPRRFLPFALRRPTAFNEESV